MARPGRGPGGEGQGLGHARFFVRAEEIFMNIVEERIAKAGFCSCTHGHYSPCQRNPSFDGFCHFWRVAAGAGNVQLLLDFLQVPNAATDS